MIAGLLRVLGGVTLAGLLVLSPSELVSRPESGPREVTVQGEAIGEVLARGDYSWVNVGDGSTAVGVWVDSEAARTVSVTGSHAWVGDTVVVEGVFYPACPQHGGEPDLHARSLRVLAAGHPAGNRAPPRRTVWAVALLALGAISALSVWLRRVSRSSSGARPRARA